MIEAALLLAAQAVLGVHYSVEIAGPPKWSNGFFNQYLHVENTSNLPLHISVKCFAMVDGLPVDHGYGFADVASGKDTFMDVLLPGPKNATIRCEPHVVYPIP